MSRHFRVAGVEHETDGHFRDGRLTFTGDDGRQIVLRAIALGDGAWLLRDDEGNNQRAVVARHRDTWWVHCRGRTWALERVVQGGPGAAAGALTAPMHGTVEKLYVETGDEVSAGQPLLSVSAMKMQIEIKAPHDGVVRELPHGENEQVEGGEILAVVEAVQDDDEAA